MAIDPLCPDLEIALQLGPYAPRAARQHVAQVDRPSPDLRDAAVLLTSELVTRAVEGCSGALVELRVWMPHDVVRVELRGPSAALAQSTREAFALSTLLLDQIADRWQLEDGASAACMWFEIDRQRADAARTSARARGARGELPQHQIA